MQRDLVMTIWSNIWAKRGSTVTAPWSDWVAVLSNHARRTDKGGPIFSCGIIPEGRARKKEYVEATDTVCLDVDKGTNEEIGEILRAVSPYDYALYTSFSHTLHKLGSDKEIAKPGEVSQTKLRILLPFVRRVTVKEYDRIWPVVVRMVKHPIDAAIRSLNQGYYLPSAKPEAPTLAHHNQTGRWLDPDNLLELAPSPTLTETNGPKQLEAGELQTQLDSIVNKLRRIGRHHDLHEAAIALIHGKPFAELGNRHRVILHLTGWIAFKTEARPLHPEVIGALFGQSLEVMRLESPPDNVCEGVEAVVSAYETAIAKALQVKERERVEAQTKHAGPRSPQWPEESLERCCQDQGCPTEELAYVVQRDRAHYILRPDTSFAGPFVEKDAMVKVFQALGNSPIRLYEPKGDTGFRPRSFSEIVRHYGEIAERVIANLAAQRTYYDRGNNTIHEAVCPLMTREPAYNTQIDQWLRLFAGTEQNYNKLLDWLACAPDLNKLLCALTLAGAKGTGKTLFAQGVASLWAEGGAASSPEVILGNFNEDLCRCPLVFADETLPKTYRWESVTTKLRAEIATLVRTLQRKYFAPLTLQGSIRFILATNNPTILSSNISTSNDLNAVAERFMYLDTSSEAERYLLNLAPEVKNQWRTDGIASYSLWLQANREVAPAGRFWVTGDIDKMHRLLVTSSDWNSWVCEWIVKGLLDAFKKSDQNQATTGRVQIGEGRLFVATGAITDGWQLYTNYPTTSPDPRKIATALRSIALSPKTVQRRPNNYRFFDIDLNHLVAWAEEKGICGQQDIDFAITQGITERPKVINLDEKRKGKDQQ